MTEHLYPDSHDAAPGRQRPHRRDVVARRHDLLSAQGGHGLGQIPREGLGDLVGCLRVAPASSCHGRERLDHGLGVQIYLSEREGVRGDRLDTEGFKQFRREVTNVVGDDGRCAEVDGQGQDMAVLVVERTLASRTTT